MHAINNVIKFGEFVCPNCRSPLSNTDDLLTCGKCRSSWTIEYGIPRFANSEVEWSVFDSNIASKVTELAENVGWKEAIDTFSNTLGTYTVNYIKDESRADWHVVLPLHADATVLDIGSGWGNIALSLSRWCKQVYCCDVNMINLRLLNVRMRDNGITNVTTFQYEPNSFLRLPFLDSSIDIVVLNGVLEWMGVAAIEASPTRIQIEALKEIRRVLKPGGALYIGIENRYSIAALRGLRIHGELPFVGLFPRFISNLITKLIRRKPHRTYIYSLGGYRRLLSQGGFLQTDFYLPYPSYHHPNSLIPLEPAWMKQYWINQMLTSRKMKYKLFMSLGLSRLPFHWLAFSYGIRCVK